MNMESTFQQKSPEDKQDRLNKKIEGLQIPDNYGYVIESGVIQTVALMNELGINTTQSDEGGDNISVSPWIEFGSVDPYNIYEGEEELKNEYMKEHKISPNEIDRTSKEFSREKEVEVQAAVRKSLISEGAAYTSEFNAALLSTQEAVRKLQGFVDEFYGSSNEPSDVKVKISFPYKSPKYDPEIQDTPILEVVSIKGELGIESSEQVKLEFKRFTDFLREKYLNA